MSDYQDNLQKLIADLRIGISLCTRLPVGPSAEIAEGDVARASWTFPIAGLLVGIVAALVYWIAIRANAAPFPAAAVTLAATLLLTGAMHEDGLADTADGLGGRTREQKLEIMRDSRIGTFGACALAISLLLARLATRQFGGQTGDVLGAMEQIAECVIFLAAASRF